MKIFLKNGFRLLLLIFIIYGTKGCFDSDDIACMTTKCQEINQSIAELNQIMSGLCYAISRCDPSFSTDRCYDDIYFDKVPLDFWDRLGLPNENAQPIAEIQDDIESGSIRINHAVVEPCQNELGENCDNVGEAFPIHSYDDAKNLILLDGDCSSLLLE